MRSLENLFKPPEQPEREMLMDSILKRLEEQASVKDQWFDFMAERGVELEVAYAIWENQSRYGAN